MLVHGISVSLTLKGKRDVAVTRFLVSARAAYHYHRRAANATGTRELLENESLQ